MGTDDEEEQEKREKKKNIKKQVFTRLPPRLVNKHVFKKAHDSLSRLTTVLVVLSAVSVLIMGSTYMSFKRYENGPVDAILGVVMFLIFIASINVLLTSRKMFGGIMLAVQDDALKENMTSIGKIK